MISLPRCLTISLPDNIIISPFFRKCSSSVLSIIAQHKEPVQAICYDRDWARRLHRHTAYGTMAYCKSSRHHTALPASGNSHPGSAGTCRSYRCPPGMPPPPAPWPGRTDTGCTRKNRRTCHGAGSSCCRTSGSACLDRKSVV